MDELGEALSNMMEQATLETWLSLKNERPRSAAESRSAYAKRLESSLAIRLRERVSRTVGSWAEFFQQSVMESEPLPSTDGEIPPAEMVSEEPTELEPK